MKNKQLLPILSAIVIFMTIALLYVIQPLSEGKKIHMGDITKHKGQSRELAEFKKQTGENTLWTNTMFGGMPTYLISTPKAPWLNRTLHKTLNLNNFRPVSFLFLYMLGFFIALLCFGINPWLSIIGGIAYGFSSYFFILIPAGHAAKAIALGYMPAIIGGVHLAYNKKRLLGAAIFALFLALQILINHLQITYYTFIVILIYGIAQLITAIKAKTLPKFLVTSIYLVFFGLVAIGSNFRTLWTTYEYGNYSIRGKSELTSNADNKTTGLDRDYATDWSYGVGESFTLLIPNFKGGATVAELPQDSETYKFLAQVQGKKQAKQTIKRMPLYWGDQPFTSGPVYVGAIICFLFVLGLFVLDRKTKWWLLTATIVSLFLAWGKNVPALTNFLLDHLPGYNKFRAVSTTLVIAEFTMPLLAILALAKILQNEIKEKELTKGITWAAGITGGFALLFALFGKGMFNFEAPGDQQYLAQGATDIVDAWQSDRAMLLRKDAFRSFIFIMLAAGVLFAYMKNKLKLNYAMAALGFLILIDMWPVNKRYFNNDHFETKKENKAPYVASAADKIILQDKDPNYRVLNMAVSPFQDASTSYFHKSIGGYHGAKWRRYQELYEQAMFTESQGIIGSLQRQNMQLVQATLANAHVLNMLNTKYIIYNPNAQPLVNPSANGNAWFVNSYRMVANADEEMAAITQINTKEMALIDERFADFVSGKTIVPDSTASVKLLEYQPNYLKYQSNTNTEQLALFSEIYYPKGWVAKIDGEEAGHFRANYLLRAMMVPAGEHTIEFSFEPASYHVGGKVAMASSWILFLSLLAAVTLPIIQNRKEQDK